MTVRCIRSAAMLMAVLMAMAVFAPAASAVPKGCPYEKQASGWYWKGACSTGSGPDAYKPFNDAFFDTSDVGLQTPPDTPEGLMTLDYDFASGTVDFSMSSTYLMDQSADSFQFMLSMTANGPGSADFSLFVQGTGAGEFGTIAGTLSVNEDGQQLVTVSDSDLAELATRLGISKDAALAMVESLVQAGDSNAQVAVEETKGDAKKANAEGGSDAGTEGGSEGGGSAGEEAGGTSTGDVGGAMDKDQ